MNLSVTCIYKYRLPKVIDCYIGHQSYQSRVDSIACYQRLSYQDPRTCWIHTSPRIIKFIWRTCQNMCLDVGTLIGLPSTSTPAVNFHLPENLQVAGWCYQRLSSQDPWPCWFNTQYQSTHHQPPHREPAGRYLLMLNCWLVRSTGFNTSCGFSSSRDPSSICVKGHPYRICQKELSKTGH